MCTQGRWIYNRYVKRSYFVPCGHCDACKQQKANRRTNRLKAELSDGRIALFVTLTYDNASIPYIRKEDVLNKVSDLNVYRDVEIRRSKDGTFTRYYQTQVLRTVPHPDYFNTVDLDGNLKLKTLKGRKHNIGVIFYPDVQNFVKRLRINLQRKYKYYETFKAFCVAEYGERTHRNHFHLLVFIPFQDEKLFRSAICEAWPYADSYRTKKGIEVARNAASYCSSYVNCGSDFPQFLQNHFRPKHSFSKGLGMGLPDFQLDAILSKIKNGCLDFTRQVRQGDATVYARFPIPKYVVNRFFPLFKGYSRIVGFTLHDLLRNPFSLLRFKEIDYTLSDIHKIAVRFRNAYMAYFYPKYSFDDYLAFYESAWRVYKSTIYRFFMEDDTPLLEKYDNLYLAFVEPSKGGIHPDFDIPPDTDLNPNHFASIMRTTDSLSHLYYLKNKTRKVTNTVQSQTNYQL